MSDVFIVGIGLTPVGEHWDKSLANLSARAMLDAIHDAGNLRPQALYVGNMLASAVSNQANLGTMLAENAGLTHIETFTAEAGEASGAAALHLGYLAVKSGAVDSALVVGVEKYTDMIGPEVEANIAQSGDSDFEIMQGLTPAGQAALHGAVFSWYFGRTNRHVPVLFISVEMFERDMNNDIFSACFGSVVISFYRIIAN